MSQGLEGTEEKKVKLQRPEGEILKRYKISKTINDFMIKCNIKAVQPEQRETEEKG